MTPTSFDQLVGQTRVISVLRTELATGFPRHCLLTGPPGLGKTTLAGICAIETHATPLYWQVGTTLTPRRIMLELMQLACANYSTFGAPRQGHERYILALDEVHNLTDFDQWNSILSSRELAPDPSGGVSWLPILSVFAMTTQPHLLPDAFKSRFPIELRLEDYSQDDLAAMILKSYKMPKVHAQACAMRARGSARLALNMAETVARHGMVAFELLEIDAEGLRPVDHCYLDALRRSMRPLSLNTLAAMIGENSAVVRDTIEPYLLRKGLIAITPKGRELVGLQLSRGRLNVRDEIAKVEGYAG